MASPNFNDFIQTFRVYVRVRSLNEKEEQLINKTSRNFIENFLNVTPNQITVNLPVNLEYSEKKDKTYYFDEIFPENLDNLHIFEKVVKNMVDSVLNGYNSTALAYGVTGAGKTYTMFGDIYSQVNNEKGICTYSIEYLFKQILKDENNKSFKIKISYLEIYNEQVIDLLSKKTLSLMIIEDPIKGTVVPELSEYSVSSTSELINLIIQGNYERTMAATGQNQFSSRSHAILQIVVEQNKKDGQSLYSKFLMVDLAGSERGAFEKGIRLQEGSNINKSLLALGNCINLLSDKSKKGSFIPYRDSKLTRLLKDSLGGNILTVMIACISPSVLSYDDTINTLNYANRARKIQKKITKNIRDQEINPSNYRDIIYSLNDEIIHLKEIISNQKTLIRNINQENLFNVEKPIIQNNYSNIIINNINTSANEIKNNYILNKKENKNMYSVNTENYHNFLIKCSSSVSISYDDIEIFLDNLQNDKIFLEEQINKGVNYDESSNKLIIIMSYYEKYLEMIYEKMVYNIEQNLILTCNLKEITELNISNQQQIQKLLSQQEIIKSVIHNPEEEKFKEIEVITDEINNTKKIFAENEKVRENIMKSLEIKSSNKRNLKTILLKLISNSSKKEVINWNVKYIIMIKQAYKILEKENKELQMKNNKYKTYISSILKEKDDIEKKYSELFLENEMIKAKHNKHISKPEIINDKLQQKFATEEMLIICDSEKEKTKYSSSDQNDLNKYSKFLFFNEIDNEKIFKAKSKTKNLKIKETEKKTDKYIKKDNYNFNQFNTDLPYFEKIDIDIQKITPLSNFKINIETGQIQRLDTTDVKKTLAPKNSQFKLVKNKKISFFNPQMTNKNNLQSNMVSQRITEEDQIENKVKTPPNTNLVPESILNTNNMNNSLSISKVTFGNEICYYPENEVIDNFLNSELVEGDLLDKKKNEDCLIINQLNELINHTKSVNKQMQTQIFSKIDPKTIAKAKKAERKMEQIPGKDCREQIIFCDTNSKLNKIYMKREIKSIDRKYSSVHTIMNNYSLKRSRSMPFGEYFLKHVGFNE